MERRQERNILGYLGLYPNILQQENINSLTLVYKYTKERLQILTPAFNLDLGQLQEEVLNP